MKVTILVALMVALVATPCFAQEVETDGIFSLHGTVWKMLPIALYISPFPFFWFYDDSAFGFYGGIVYEGYEEDLRVRGDFYYKDFLILSIFGSGNSMSTNQGIYYPTAYYGIVSSIGIGMIVTSQVPIPPSIFPIIRISLLIKTDDNWTPPEIPPDPVFISISPNQGEQGTTLTDVSITGANTNFKSELPLISFRPYDGLIVSNISVISNTEIEFDLKIAADAPVGFRNVTVHGKEYIFGNDAFKVLPRTN